MDVNPYLIEMLGYSYEQFVEKGNWEIGPFKICIIKKNSELKKRICPLC
jgi:two-component system CheB/CheR fusion protein